MIWKKIAPAVVLLAACSGTTNQGDAADASPQSSDAARDAASESGGSHDAGTDVSPPGDGGDPLDPSLQPPVDMNTADYPANVWVTSSMVKVQPSATPGNVHWALVSAARNEFESFQVHVAATSSAISMSVSVTDLVNAHTSDRIAASNITISREAYLNITQLSDANGTLGMTPDPLIPTQDHYANEPRNAFPVMVPTGETRSAWIDVLVPAATPSGYYTGTVTVNNGTTMLAQLPILLKVWNFSLPSTPTLRTAFDNGWDSLCQQAYGGYTGCGQFPGANGDSDTGVELVHVMTAKFFLDHRVSVGDVVYDGPDGSDWTHFDATYSALFSGTASTILAGAQMTAVRYQGDITSTSAIALWANHFQTQNWLPELYYYDCDEPPNGGCSWSMTQAEATTVRNGSSLASYLLTTNIAEATSNNLLDTVDILTPIVEEMDPQGGMNQRASYDTWLTQPGKTLFWYQSCESHGSCCNGEAGDTSQTYPSYMADASPMRNRIFQWLAYLNGVQGELYYDVDLCWDSPGCDMGMQPWLSIYANGGNGDGTLYYPGVPAMIGGTTPVPMSSIRLELIRDGVEDYEYLNMLSTMGDDAFARSTSAAFITNAYTFSNDPTQLLSARDALGNRLHQQSL